MSKIGLLLNYWIYILVVLLLSKVFGLADSTIILFTTLAIATLAYIPIIKFLFARQSRKAQRRSERSEESGKLEKSGKSNTNKYKNKRKKKKI